MRRAVVAAMLAVAAVAGAVGAGAQSAEPVRVAGRIVHGDASAPFAPEEARVTLTVLEGGVSLSESAATPDAGGEFAFDTAFAQGRTYFFAVEYDGAAYSATRTASTLGEPVVITVYDATHDTSAIAFESYTVIVTGAVPEEGFVEVLERALVRNDSGMTLVPDGEAEGPAMMSFLRFALPPNSYNLDVRSNLVGGQVLEVDRGFALTTPILPTAGQPHQFEFVYRLDYDQADPQVDLSRTMRFGAESFRFVAPVDVASPASPRLDDLGATELNGRLLRLLEGQDVAPAEVVPLSVSGLPALSGLDRALASAGEWYVLYAAPGAVALAAAAFALAAARRRRPAAAGREELLAEARELSAAYESREIDRAAYASRRQVIRERLVELEVARRLHDDEGAGRSDS